MRTVHRSSRSVPNRRLPDRARRQGGLLVEAMIASMAIGTAAILSVTMLITVGSNRRTAARTLLATQELSNQLERLAARPYADLTPELAAAAQLSASAAASLPEGQLRIMTQTVALPRPGKRLAGELSWRDRGNSWRPPLRMTTWVFAPREAP